MEEHTIDDQSHYEISLTAGQAFVAFVLLLLSLAASFAFGLMIGKGQADERLVVRKETPVVTEASLIPKKGQQGRIVELGVDSEEFHQNAATDTATATDTAATSSDATATTIEEAPATTSDATVAAPVPAQQSAPAAAVSAPAAAPAAPSASAPAVPHFAQLLSTSDQKTAESLAARLINGGFTNAYVERGTSEKGPVYRVRVRFASEGDAHAAESRLRTFSKDVWITK